MTEATCLFQGSNDPIFEGSEPIDFHLFCKNGCGQMLIRNYYPENFVSINIRCYRCDTVTITPPLEIGEVLSMNTILVGHSGKYLISGTVNYDPKVMIAGSPSVVDAIKNSAPQGIVLSRDLNRNMIEDTRQRYIDLTGVDYDRQRHIVSKGGKDIEYSYPLVWALEEFISSSAGGIIFRTKGLRAATDIISLFNTVYDRWDNSFRFKSVGAQFGAAKQFFHTAFTLMAADHYYTGGNMVGLSLENDHGVPNPDLYIRRRATEKFYFEIKTPLSLQVTAPTPDRKQIKATLESVVKHSSRQINRYHRGGLLVGISTGNYNEADLTRYRDNIVKSRGRYHSGLAFSTTIARVANEEGFETAYRFQTSKNEHFVAKDDTGVIIYKK